MKSNSILPHQNYESILFIGGPFDTQYIQVAKDIDYYIHKNKEINGSGDYIYRKQTFPWKEDRIINLMVMDGVPESYMQYLTKSFEDGMEENLPLPIVIMCLPSVEQFITVKEKED